MYIEENDCLAVYYYLLYEQERGKEWMAYELEDGAVKMPNIHCFDTRHEMIAFQQQYDMFSQNYNEAKIGPVVDMLQNEIAYKRGHHAETLDIDVPYQKEIDLVGFLAGKALEGNTWVVFDKDAVLREKDLYCSQDGADAETTLHCYRDRGSLTMMPVEELIAALTRETRLLDNTTEGIKINADGNAVKVEYVYALEASKGLLLKNPIGHDLLKRRPEEGKRDGKQSLHI